jgi:hypothetical protein
LINSLPDDESMGAVVDALDKPWAERSVQENKKVTLTNAYLVAYARESDNDYHLIITNAGGTRFFNVELSGLPSTNAASYQKLRAARNYFDENLGAPSCGGYVFFDTPLRIKKLTGSLFFDTDHPAGAVGPQGYKPERAWEIHPVSTIEFELE